MCIRQMRLGTVELQRQVGPGENALVVAYYLQRMIGAELQTKGYGMSCAMSWMYSIVLIIITRIGFKISDTVVSYD